MDGNGTIRDTAHPDRQNNTFHRQAPARKYTIRAFFCSLHWDGPGQLVSSIPAVASAGSSSFVRGEGGHISRELLPQIHTALRAADEVNGSSVLTAEAIPRLVTSVTTMAP